MRNFNASQKQAMMSKLLASRQGRARIAASVTGPLRTLRDYVSVARRAFMLDELPDGALPVYDVDPEIPCYVVSEEGDNIQQVVKSPRLHVPLFELSANPTIPFVQAKERRFDVISRIKKKTRDELFRLEDTKLFALMVAAGMKNTVNQAITVTRANLKWETLVDAFARIETHGLRVDKIFMNGFDFTMVRNIGREHADFETQRELLKTGLMARAYGAEIFQSPQVPKGKIILVTEPEYLGVMPIRIDLTVLPADEPGKRRYGWSVFENIGASVYNLKGIQVISITG